MFLLETFSKTRDILMMMIIGVIIEASRRICQYQWSLFWNSQRIDIHLHHPDDTYSWAAVWLSKNCRFGKCRAVEVSTSSWGAKWAEKVILPGEKGESGEYRRLRLLPAYNTESKFVFEGVRGSVFREQGPRDTSNDNHKERFIFSFQTRDDDITIRFIKAIKECYLKDGEDTTRIFRVSKFYNIQWELSTRQAKRSLDSVVIDETDKKTIINDIDAFLKNEDWYIKRGIPYRRGYLLHGVPGSGKTSLIQGLAGKFDMDIHVLCLSSYGLDDNSLQELVSKLPKRTILLIEDIDVAFRSSPTKRDRASGSLRDDLTAHDGVTYAGLLNALDGVGGPSGLITFATTNRLETVDAALKRAGRIDHHLEFTNATPQQAKQLFLNFFRPDFPSFSDQEDAKALKNSPIDLDSLADGFSKAVAEQGCILSMASLQNHLIQFKDSPEVAKNAKLPEPDYKSKETVAMTNPNDSIKIPELTESKLAATSDASGPTEVKPAILGQKA